MITLGEAVAVKLAPVALDAGRREERALWLERVAEVERLWKRAEEQTDTIAGNALFEALRILRGEPPWRPM